MSTAAFVHIFYDSWVVGTVRVVVHNLGPVNPGAQVSHNHWTISLLVGGNKHILDFWGPHFSVRLDMQPVGPQNGQLFISFHQYLVSQSATRYFDFEINLGFRVTVRQVKVLLQARGRHRYSMTEHGGCQHWCWTIIHDFCEAGIIPSIAAEQLRLEMENNYSLTLPPIRHKIEQGHFY
ncbi:hypothetical protein H2198_004051 [Neophaeococcomyces mojaviensis]|uniref:Uncharacterized protein n=1 Tax=Neophaeococcomyces mojaviensis TaxID=3383035 RepID=A0ACC3AA19_9EURO|nr:hypothetical protein H2198_004051 [Knufia sp. JES_112]